MQNPFGAFLASEYWKSRVLAPEIRRSGDVSDALRIVRSRWPETFAATDDSEAPIFLLSAGWGSGSTLLQRLIASNDRTLLWGEPHDHAVPVHRLAQMLVPVSDRWPRDSYFLAAHGSEPLHNQWIANLSPPLTSMRIAHRSFVENWLKESAAAVDRTIWGMKEVRLTVDHARYLKWLFPNAKFVFMYRDIIDSYRSCKGVRWFSVWPDYRVSRPSAFAHHWKHLLQGFLSGADELGALLVRYEDLTSGQLPLSVISDHLEIGTLDNQIMEKRLGSRGARNKSLAIYEEWMIRGITEDLRSELNYE